MNSLARIFAAIARAMRGAFGFVSDTFDEVFEPLTKRLPWLRDRARAAGRLAGQGASVAADAAAITAEAALKAPGAIGREVGSVIGSMLPVPPVTGRALAEGAAISDEELKRIVESVPADEDGFFERQRPKVGLGHFLQHAVEAFRDGGERALAPHVRWISEPAAEWVRSLSHTQIEAALAMAPDALKRHVTPEKQADISPLLPALLPAPTVDPTLVTEEMKADIIARAKRSMRAEPQAVAEMMKWGPAAPTRPEPRFDATPDEAPVYRRGYRPRGAY